MNNAQVDFITDLLMFMEMELILNKEEFKEQQQASMSTSAMDSNLKVLKG